jgi:hypothetical protein
MAAMPSVRLLALSLASPGASNRSLRSNTVSPTVATFSFKAANPSSFSLVVFRSAAFCSIAEYIRRSTRWSSNRISAMIVKYKMAKSQSTASPVIGSTVDLRGAGVQRDWIASARPSKASTRPYATSLLKNRWKLLLVKIGALGQRRVGEAKREYSLDSNFFIASVGYAAPDNWKPRTLALETAHKFASLACRHIASSECPFFLDTS